MKINVRLSNTIRRLIIFPGILSILIPLACHATCFSQSTNQEDNSNIVGGGENVVPFYDHAASSSLLAWHFAQTSNSVPAVMPEFLWNKPEMQNQLDMAPAQIEELKQLEKDFQNEINSLYSDYQNVYREALKENSVGSHEINNEAKKKLEEIRSEIAETKKKFVEDIDNKVLLPFQVESKNRLQIINKIRTHGFLRQIGTSGTLDNYVGLNKEQIERIKKIKSELDKKTKKLVAELFDEAKDEVVQALDRDQRKRAEEIFDHLEYQSDKCVLRMLDYEPCFLFDKPKKDDRRKE